MPEPSRATFGGLLRTLRRRAGMTQRRLAEAAGLEPTYLSKLEHDAVVPGEEAIRRLAEALAADRDELSVLAGKPAPSIVRAAMGDPGVSELMRAFPGLGPTRRSRVLSAAGVGRRSPILADARDLEEWSRRPEAQAGLPLLVQQLVLATGDGLRRASFLGGEAVSRSGWDGLVEADRPTAFIPEGASGWELSVRADLGKVRDDVANRTMAPEPLDPATSTFVYVTARRVHGKDVRATELRRGSPWRAVRILDAGDLEAWLGQAPAVHLALSAQLGKLTDGVRTLDAAWRAWSEACSPRLSAALTVAGREEARSAILSGIRSGPGVLVLRADSPEEGIAFLAAAISSLAEPDRVLVHGMTVVCDTPEAWRTVSSMPGPLVLVTSFPPADAALAAESGHLVVIAGSRDLPASGAIDLPLPDRTAVRAALAEMLGPDREGPLPLPAHAGASRRGAGMAGGGVEELATVGRRSLLSLRRRLAISPAVQRPPWASGPGARDLVALALAGAWDEAREGDAAVVARLAGAAYEAVAARCSQLAIATDPPLRRHGSIWLATSREDLWALVAAQLSAPDVATFAQEATDVLRTVDPGLGLPRSERWMAGVRGLVPPHSPHLRKGLAETVLMLADSPSAIAGQPGQLRADRIVATILAAANADPAGRLWATLGDVLPLLAEAAPERFLEAVERGLVGDAPPLAALLEPADDGVFGPPPDATGLLWALEVLAWSPSHLARAAEALIRLDELDSGAGRWANRPGSSLRAVFLPWHPGTAASLEARLTVLETLRRRHPAAAHRLLLALLPRLHDWAEPTRQPGRREWSAEGRDPTWAEVAEHADRMVGMLATDAGADPERWGELLDALPGLTPSARATVLAGLEEAARSAAGAGWAELGDKARDSAAEHRRSPQARWRLPEVELARLESIASALRSPDPARAGAWLFDSAWPPLPIPMTGDLERYRAELERQRDEYAAMLYGTGGPEAVEACARTVREPFMLGCTMASIAMPPEDEARVVEALRTADPALSRFGRGYVAAHHAHDGWPWTEAMLARIGAVWAPKDSGLLLATLQPVSRASWEWAARLGPEAELAYWSGIAPLALEDQAEAPYVAGRLVDAGRARLAVEVLSAHIEALRHPTDDHSVISALESVLRADLTEGDVGMLGWEVARLLDFLEEAPDPDRAGIARLEFGFLPLLRHAGREPRVLHRELAARPAFFVEVLSLAYRGDAEPPRDLGEQERIRAQLAHELLSSWETAPGTAAAGVLDAAALRSWVLAALDLCAAAGRRDIGAQQIGRVLRHSPGGSDGIWPAEAVRELIQELADDDLDLGLELEIGNSRGATWRGLTDGGLQERELAARYRSDAASIGDRWPRAAAILGRVAEALEGEARFEDVRADLMQDTWS